MAWDHWIDDVCFLSSSFLWQPCNLHFALDRSILRIAGDEIGFVFLGQRGSEGVRKAEAEAGFQIRR